MSPAAYVAFAAVLFLAVLVSGIAHRTVLSTAALFLVAGFVLGDGVTGVIDPGGATGDHVMVLAELALFAVLFTDGMHLGFGELRRAWRLPGRALAVGMPLTFAVTALLGRYVAGLDWTSALLVGAVLAPTDPVFASALVGREEVPHRLRHLLNVESGLNDGLALPVVLVILSVAGQDDIHATDLAAELALGVLVGLVVPYLAIRLERLPWLSATSRYEPISAFAIGLLVLTICVATHANLFLGAFTAGVTMASFGKEQREAFHQFGDLVTELLKLAAVFVFGALISPAFLADIPLRGWLFAVLTLLLARTLTLGLALVRSPLTHRERAAAAWFGPKGFASVVYGLLVLDSGVPDADEVFHLVALAVALSILAHSSTDVLLARRFRDAEPVAPESTNATGSDRGRDSTG